MHAQAYLACAQARLRNTHPRQLLLRSKGGNGKCSHQHSDVRLFVLSGLDKESRDGFGKLGYVGELTEKAKGVNAEMRRSSGMENWDCEESEQYKIDLIQ